MLTQAYLREILTYSPWTGEFYWLSGRRMGMRAGAISGGGIKGQYIVIKIDGKNYYAHRLAFLWMGYPEPDQVDHQNTNKLVNCWGNIRPATSTQNKYNVLIDAKNKCGLKGVHWDRQRHIWRSRIKHPNGGKYESLGSFSTKQAAYKAYCTRAAEIHGEFGKGI